MQKSYTYVTGSIKIEFLNKTYSELEQYNLMDLLHQLTTTFNHVSDLEQLKIYSLN